jgi:hypothetical protein
MTAAQKKARAIFKKAIEYRKKHGVGLKQAFAIVKGKKVSGVKESLHVKKELKKKGLKMPHGYKTSPRKRVSGVFSKSLGSIAIGEIQNNQARIKYALHQIEVLEHLLKGKTLTPANKALIKSQIKNWKEHIKDYKKHTTALKKHL